MEDSEFISGIYNYCDRWCERCRFVHRCRVSADVEKSRRRLESKGIDPDSQEGIEESLKDSLGKSLKMLRAMAEEQGIDISHCDPEMEEQERRGEEEVEEHPLCKTAMEYATTVQGFLERVRAAIEEQASDLMAAIRAVRDCEGIDALKKIRDAYDTVQWDQYLIGVKLHRALRSRYDEEREDDELLQDCSASDANGSAKVAYLCTVRSMGSVRRIIEWDESLSDEAITLLVLLDRVRKGIDAEIPGHRDFKRPGLDDTDTEGWDDPDPEDWCDELPDEDEDVADDPMGFDADCDDEGLLSDDIMSELGSNWELAWVLRKKLRELLPSDLSLPSETELSDEEIEGKLEKLAHVLAQYKIGFSFSPKVPPRSVYKHIVEDMLDDDVPLVSDGGYYLDGCDGSCPDCFQRPWCDAGQELDWDEDASKS